MSVVPPKPVSAGPAAVLLCAELDRADLIGLLSRYQVEPVDVEAGQEIPGSYWGAPEAGLIGRRLFLRADTPVHSLLHELAHFICMSDDRRRGLDTDAGGDDDEECAVCYLEVLLADELESFGAERCLSDMDSWGYSFRQGSARAWLDGDGTDARDWLRRYGLIDAGGRPSWQLREN